MEIFNMLDQLNITASGLDQLPVWLLRLAAPVFAKPIAALFNISLEDCCNKTDT